MDVGLERGGFDPLLCLEIDQMARETLRTNRPHWVVPSDGDVVRAAHTLEPAQLGISVGELDLLCGGPPCQPFSKAAQWASSGRQGMGDLRADTVHATLDLLERFLPRVLLLENVQGFLVGPGSALDVIAGRLQSINSRHKTSYRMEWTVVDAADFGVPQHRKRAIVVILRDELKWSWPSPTYNGRPVTAWEAIGDLAEDAYPPLQGKWAELLRSVPEGWNYQWFTSRGGGPELFGYRTKYWNFLLKLAKNRPSWTLPASPGPSAGPFHWQNRPLTARERLRLQSFPDDWRLPGDYRAQTKLTGNATPPLLAEVLGRQIATVLGRESEGGLSLVRPRANVVPEAEPVAPLPGAYAGLVGTKDAHMGPGRGPSPRPAAALV